MPDDALNIAGTTITVGKDAATPAITFTASKAWTAESDSEWIVPDQTSGEAGEVTLNLAVSENDTWAERSGKVTVTVGEVKTVFTIVQGTTSVLETAFTFNVGPEAQVIGIPVKSNVEYTVTPDAEASWITVVATKAAPSDGTIKIGIAANTELAPRTGSFTVAAPGYSQTYIVAQAASWIPASSATAVYISNSQKTYDDETWSLTTFQQFVVVLTTDGGDVATLVLNKNPEEAPVAIDKIPVGEFEVDASGTYADNTFSIISSKGTEKYYTGLVSGEREVAIYDGAITVEEEDGVYTITAILVDAVGELHNYSYVGAIEVDEEYFVGSRGEVNWKNTYDTYFTTKANGWEVNFYLPRGCSEVAYVSFSIFSEAGEVDLNSFPVGTYSYSEAADEASLTYKNGKKSVAPGTLTSATVSLLVDGVYKYTNVDPTSTTLIVSKNDDGSYNFKYSATVAPYYYDDNYNLVNEDPVQVSVDIDAVLDKASDTQNHPADDEENVVVTSLDGAAGTQYIGYWYGSNIGSEIVEEVEQLKPAIAGTPCNVFTIGSNSYFNNTWSGSFSIISVADWSFVRNFSNRYCSNEVPAGTYTFSSTAQIGALIPLRYGAASRCSFTNNYTGTAYYPVAGSITLSGGKITLDLTCKATEASLEGRPNSPATITVKGTTPFTCYYLQDWSALTRVKQFSINSPVPLD